jgi:hypothetical protein
MSGRIKLMRLLILLLLTPVLLGTACNQPVQRQVQIQNPPSDVPPVVWRYNHATGFLGYWIHPGAQGIEMANYIMFITEDGRRKKKEWGLIPPFSTEGQGFHVSVESLGITDGYFIHYGEDRTWNRLYGGRKFRWQYRFRLHTNENPWRFEAPVGPVSFVPPPPLERFPWEPGLSGNPWTNPPIRNVLNTTGILGPMIGCFQQNMDSMRLRGIYIRAFNAAAVRFIDVGRTGPTTMTFNLVWRDRKFTGIRGRDIPFSIAITGNQPLDVHHLNNRLNEIIVLAFAEGRGPYTQAWERRVWRLAGRNFGGFTNPDGSVRCERGEWILDEITDPAVVQMVAGWVDNRQWPADNSPIDPRLVPAGW